MKNLFKAVAVLMLVVTVSACGTTTHNIKFVESGTDKVIDQRIERKNASNPFAPSTVMVFDRVGDKIVTEHYAAGATPMEQISPAAAGAAIAYGQVEAAERTEPDVINNNVMATGGKANANAAAINWTKVRQSVSQTTWNRVVNCNQPVMIGGRKHYGPGC